MAGSMADSVGWRGNRFRIAVWAAAGLLVLLPFVVMPFTDEVDWDLADFVVFGTMLVVAGLIFELLVRKARNDTYRTAVGVAVAAAFFLVWMTLAVGIIGNENDDANLMVGGVLAVGVIGALIARFRPSGMARAMFTTALAQVLVALAALIAGWGTTSSNWPRDILGATAVFVALWLISAMLFRGAALEGS